MWDDGRRWLLAVVICLDFMMGKGRRDVIISTVRDQAGSFASASTSRALIMSANVQLGVGFSDATGVPLV